MAVHLQPSLVVYANVQRPTRVLDICDDLCPTATVTTRSAPLSHAPLQVATKYALKKYRSALAACGHDGFWDLPSLWPETANVPHVRAKFARTAAALVLVQLFRTVWTSQAARAQPSEPLGAAAVQCKLVLGQLRLYNSQGHHSALA